MQPLELLLSRGLIAAIELISNLLILCYVLAALFQLVRPWQGDRLQSARLLVTEGALWGLSFKVAATLLNTLMLHSWQQFALFSAIFALRTLLRYFFTWEQQKLRQPSPMH